MSPALRILSPGLLTTIQDLGRVGYQRIGIPVGGALDPLSLRAANLLVGNPPDAGCLEMAGVGPTFSVDADSVRVAFVGASAAIIRSDAAAQPQTLISLGRGCLLNRGDVVKVGRLVGSATLLMAVEGGFDVAPVLGSVATYLRGAFGGFQGRALQSGDPLPLRRARAPERRELALDLADFGPPSRLRVVEGPQSDHFTDEEREAFFGRSYLVAREWSRMGFRVEGTPLRHRAGYAMTSDAVVRGSIQAPGDGLPIVLTAEHQTTGGYPKVGAVISADLPALGRLAPGAQFVFERVGLEEADAARKLLSVFIERLPARLRPAAPPSPQILTERLIEANLVSGVVDARRFVN